jgi:hypothetical protein
LLLPAAGEIRAALAEANAAASEFGLPVSASIPVQPCLIDVRTYPRIGFTHCAVGGRNA